MRTGGECGSPGLHLPEEHLAWAWSIHPICLLGSGAPAEPSPCVESEDVEGTISCRRRNQLFSLSAHTTAVNVAGFWELVGGGSSPHQQAVEASQDPLVQCSLDTAYLEVA